MMMGGREVVVQVLPASVLPDVLRPNPHEPHELIDVKLIIGKLLMCSTIWMFALIFRFQESAVLPSYVFDPSQPSQVLVAVWIKTVIPVLAPESRELE